MRAWSSSEATDGRSPWPIGSRFACRRRSSYPLRTRRLRHHLQLARGGRELEHRQAGKVALQRQRLPVGAAGLEVLEGTLEQAQVLLAHQRGRCRSRRSARPSPAAPGPARRRRRRSPAGARAPAGSRRGRTWWPSAPAGSQHRLQPLLRCPLQRLLQPGVPARIGRTGTAPARARGRSRKPATARAASPGSAVRRRAPSGRSAPGPCRFAPTTPPARAPPASAPAGSTSRSSHPQSSQLVHTEPTRLICYTRPMARTSRRAPAPARGPAPGASRSREQGPSAAK